MSLDTDPSECDAKQHVSVRFECANSCCVEMPIDYIRKLITDKTCALWMMTHQLEDARWSNPVVVTVSSAENKSETKCIVIKLADTDMFVFAAMLDAMKSVPKNIKFPWNDLPRVRQMWTLCGYFGLHDAFANVGTTLTWLDGAVINVKWGGRSLLRITIQLPDTYSVQPQIRDAQPHISETLHSLDGWYRSCNDRWFSYEWRYVDSLTGEDVKDIMRKFIANMELAIGAKVDDSRIYWSDTITAKKRRK